MGTGNEGVKMLRFLVIGVSRTCAGFAYLVYLYMMGGIVVHLNICVNSVFLPLVSLSMVEALCGVGENRTVQMWRGHGSDADSGSHSLHVHPSITMSCVVGMCLGRHCVWIHRRQRSHWMRFRSSESPPPRRHRKHGG